ncbi:MAG: RDD family protein [Acidobacteriota bacterium]
MKSFSKKSILIYCLLSVFCLISLQGMQSNTPFLEGDETDDYVLIQPETQPEDEAQTEESETVVEEPDIGFNTTFPDHTYNSRRELVRFGTNQKLGSTETVREMVTILGSAEVAGKVERDMVTILGDATMTGHVQGNMVTVFGDAEIDGPVDHDLVVVFGSLSLGPNAVLSGDCVTVFGEIERDPNAVLTRDAVNVLPQLGGLKSYIMRGPLLGRLIPPGSVLAWSVVLLHFILYFLVAIILPKPAAAAAEQLERNPLICFGVGLLAMILMAPLSFILIATGVGIILLPLVSLAELALGILGKTSTLQFFGTQILKGFGGKAPNRPVVAFLVGFLLVTILYMIPILGLLVWIILRPLAFGAALLAVFRSMKKNGNGTPAPGIPVHPGNAPKRKATPAPGETMPPPPPDSGTYSASNVTPSFSVSSEAWEENAPSAETQPEVMPRAGFWIRLAATALDAVLLGWMLSFAGKFFILLWVGYFVAMWTWKGTTIGGIICRLKVVRLDGRSLDFGASLVRSLASFFSLAALGLGFFWVGWSRERQSWHDMIAGTIVARVPQSIHLI